MDLRAEGAMLYIVDDDEAVRDSLCRLLESFDWRLRAFDSAPHCLKAALHEHPSCILADLMMPHMDAFSLQRALLQHSVHVPMIVLTVHHDSHLLRKPWPPGVVDVLEKPYDAEILNAAIRKALVTQVTGRP